MADPKITNKPQVTAYAGIEAGVIRNSAKENFAMTGAILGGEVNYKGAFARAQVLGGTALGADAELGYKFDLGRNMGLELSAKTQMYKNQVSALGSTTETSANSAVGEHNIVNQNGEVITVNQSDGYNYSSTWKYGMQQTGLKAQLNFGSAKTQFGVGIEGGTRNSLRPTVSYNSEINQTIDVKSGGKTIDVQNLSRAAAINVDSESRGYVDATLKAQHNLGKGFALKAEANIPVIDKSKAFQANVGITYRLK